MFYPGEHTKKDLINVNEELLKLEGTLLEDEAKITFAKFLKANPIFTSQLLFGIELYPFQHMVIKAMEKKNFGMFILSRGYGKSFTTAISIALYAIFNPGVKIGILAPTWRQSKFIFKIIEDFSKEEKGMFFKQCIGKPIKSPDSWELPIGSSSIFSIPLGDGGRIRGYRFNLIVIDEGLLLSERIITEVIRPFLNVYFKPREREKFKKASAKLLKQGKVTQKEIDAIDFLDQKLMVLSSASYSFEYLYKMLCNYEENIFKPKEKLKPDEEISHVIFQLSYEMAPEGLLSKANIEEAKKDMSAAQFGREYEARFTDDSSGFFSVKRMRDVTWDKESGIFTQIVGNPEKKYVLAMDPNYSDNESSDHFAMCLLELDEDNRSGTMVHGYALSKSNITARATYVKYLLDNFNIVYIIVDHLGGNKFIKDINEMPVFKDAGVELKFFEDDFENVDYQQGLKNSKISYDLKSYKICHSRTFTSDWIRLANEHLQACFEHRKITFACSVADSEYEKQIKSRIPIDDLLFNTFEEEDSGLEPGTREEKMRDFIEHQGAIVELTKTECALIVVEISAQGRQSFSLPRALAKQTGPSKMRKDSYSALLLAAYGMKCYFDMQEFKSERRSFIPINFS